MYLVFIASYILLLVTFLLKKREFDFISIYIITLYLYNSITLFGLTFDPYTRTYIPVNPEIFLTSAIIFFTAIPFVLLPSFGLANKYSYNTTKSTLLSMKNLYSIIIWCLVVVGASYGFPKILAATSKVDALESTNFFVAITTKTLPIAGLLLSVINKRRAMAIFFALVLIIVFILGSRRPLVMGFLGVIIILKGGEIFRLLSSYKLIITGLIALLLVVLGKTLYGYLMREGVSGLDSWLNNFSYKYFIIGGEALNMTAILDAVITHDFTIEGKDVGKSLLAIGPLPLSWFDFSSDNFNQLFQPVLFPGINYGMAYNPWAEAYSWLGNLGVFFYSIGILITLRLLWRSYVAASPLFSVIILMMGITVSFWIHRNSLATILAYSRNILYPLVCVYFLYAVLRGLLPVKKTNYEH